MRGPSIVVACILLIFAQVAIGAPLFKVFCSGRPLYRGRADTIVTPGNVSGHVHKVSGGSNFGPATASATPLQVYNDLIKSPCTTCSLNPVDLSAYWHPDLFYKWPNGSLSLIRSGGLTVYYLFRAGKGAQANPNWKAFPPGFRMVAGNSLRRSYNASSVADNAVTFACLSTTPGEETHEFPTNRFCKNGLRLQIHFPQCWDGVNLDSPTHNTHVSYPTSPDGGDCPSTHPVRIPNLFFEAFYTVGDYPHGDGTQPFVLANGDGTGYGFHGDFLNGWNATVLQAAISDPTCQSNNTSFGNNVKNCLTLAPYVQNTPEGNCSLNRDIGLNEFIPAGATSPTLPGCNPITYGPAAATPCSSPPAQTYQPSVTTRFHLKSVSTGKYVRAGALDTQVLTADSLKTTYWETFTAVPYDAGYVGLLNDGTLEYLSAGGPNAGLTASRGSVSDWELFQLVAQANNRVAIIAKRNGKYVTVSSLDKTIAPTSTTVAGDAQLFELVSPNGGSL